MIHNIKTKEALKALYVAFKIIKPALIMPLRHFTVIFISKEPS